MKVTGNAKARCLAYKDCPYEDSRGLCSKKGNCGFKERREAQSGGGMKTTGNANQVLNEARDEYIDALKSTQEMFAKLGLSRNDADLLSGLIIRTENARQVYEKAHEDSPTLA